MPTESVSGPSRDVPRTFWQGFRLVVKVVELRLRFIVLMAVTALTFAYWDEIVNRYEKWSRPTSSRHAHVSGIEYYCPMHPQVIQDDPGTCPICGMPLAKRKAGEKTPLAPGVTARVELAPFRVEQGGIKTVAVSYAPLSQTITTVGYVAFDERRMANLIAKVPGKTRVEKLFVNFTGQDVAVGEKVAELYSPELSQAVQELLSVARRVESSRAPQTAIGRSLRADREDMVRAAEEKLRLWGVTQAQIDDILKNGQKDFTVPIISPIQGHVFRKNVVEGQEVPAGFVLFEVADLHTVWVQSQVYEHQLGSIQVGQAVEANVEAFPKKSFSGKVEFIQPHVDPATRTVDVRYTLDNPGHRLRPGMFVTVELKTRVADTPDYRLLKVSTRHEPTDAPNAEAQEICPVTSAKLGSMGEPIRAVVEGRKVWTCCKACPPKLKANPAKYLARLVPAPRDEVLSVPESAVIDTGTRKVVYVETGPGVFEGREVVLGPRVGSVFPVVDGLAPGESVAAAGAFLIDAESRLNPVAAASTDSHASTHPAPSHEGMHNH